MYRCHGIRAHGYYNYKRGISCIVYLFRLAGTQAGRKENAIGASAAPNGLVARATGPRFFATALPASSVLACLPVCLPASPLSAIPRTDRRDVAKGGRRKTERGSESEGGLHKKLTRRLFCPSSPASRCTGASGILRDSVETSPASQPTSPATSSTNKTACVDPDAFLLPPTPTYIAS